MTWKQGDPNASVRIQSLLIKFKIDSLTKINLKYTKCECLNL